ncbi:DUF6049 family protein [Demequina phytophila]|uniref:DUF6049 family protein n=1 Tax=Demequina phytophila TaxID=1638981 RepID=UPI000B0E6835|nr:DUF6049 family protein [Demequina phytophila]
MRGSRTRAAVRRALAAGAVAATAAGIAPAALAAPDGAPTVGSGTAVGTVESAPIAMVRPQQSLTSVVSVENLAATPIDGARVLLRLTRDPLEDRAALAAYLDGGSATMVTVGTADVGTPTVTSEAGGGPATVNRLAGTSSATVSVTSQQKRLPFEEDTWAVHGVQVVLRTDAGDSTLMTGAVTWVDATMPELSLATVATASGLSAQVRSIAAATDVDGVTLAIDPTAMSDLGTDTLDLSDRSVMRLPAEDPDLVSLAHAEDTALLDFALDSTVGTGASALDESSWLAIVETADRSTARLAATSGAGAMLVTGRADLESDRVTPAVKTTRAAGTSLSLLRPDGTLSSYVTAPGGAAAGTVGAAVAAGALTAAQTVAPVLVWTGDAWSPSGSGDAAALTALMNAPFVDALTVEDLTRDPSTRTSLRNKRDAANDLDASTMAGLTSRLADLTELSAVAEDPATILDPGGRTLLSPLARAIRGDTVQRELRVASSTTAVDETLSALHVAAGSDVNFIADQGSLPVTVVNDLDVDATVVVDMTSFSPNLQIRESPTVTIPARSSKTVPVDVSAVSSANVRAITVLRNADGVAIADPVSMSVRVRADWGTAVTAVFTAGLVVLLVMGVIRTVRRGRKETRTTRVGGGGDETGPSDTDTDAED